MKITFQLESAQLLVLGQFDLSFGAVCSEYIFRYLGRKPYIHVNASDIATGFDGASLSVLNNHGNVLVSECDFWQVGGG